MTKLEVDHDEFVMMVVKGNDSFCSFDIEYQSIDEIQGPCGLIMTLGPIFLSRQFYMGTLIEPKQFIDTAVLPLGQFTESAILPSRPFLQAGKLLVLTVGPPRLDSLVQPYIMSSTSSRA